MRNLWRKKKIERAFGGIRASCKYILHAKAKLLTVDMFYVIINSMIQRYPFPLAVPAKIFYKRRITAMKKILSLLLVLVLCLSLCACGDENDPSSNEPPASSTPGTSSSNGATIEITAENWQEYFELTYDRNPEQIIAGQYGEISIWGHRRLLTLKKKYASWTDDMNISIEFLCTGGYISLSNYNPKTGITS